MRKSIFALIIAALVSTATLYSKNVVNVHDVAVSVSEKGLSRTDLGHYMGICLYHGMTDLALASGDQADKDRVMNILGKISTGEIPIHYKAFIDYEVGGPAAAILAYKGETSLVEPVKACAAKMWKEQARTSDNIMTNTKSAEIDHYWIDIAATVTPFFLYAGLLENNQEYIDYAAFYALKMCKDLYDPHSGLYHQGRNHPRCPGVSEDCWSRGNGWMSMALGALLRDYPRDGKYWKEIVSTSAAFYKAVCEWQDKDGCWHQEMTDPFSYVESSGSAQVLAGLGAAIESGVLSKSKYMPYFKKGLRGLLGWVDPDGSVGHCCRGNCVPGKGKKEDFKLIHYYYNENHSFGPVVLALAQALKLGIKEIDLKAPMGSSNDADRPRAYARLITERKNDVAWENDRVAFRVYSQIASATKPLSGVDFWPKTVDYSIIDEWYDGLSKGRSYHIDHGTGCDWYEMGAGRGVGGSGIWDGEKLTCALPYKTVDITSQGPERLSFTLTYDPYEAAGETVTETKRIEMVCGTSFYKVTETVSTASGKPVTLAIGSQLFGGGEILKADGGKVFIWEDHKFDVRVGWGCDGGDPKYNGGMGTAVIVDPARNAGVVVTKTDMLQLVRVKSGESIVYYVGAKWCFQQDSGRWSQHRPFWVMSAEKESWEGLNKIYE